MQSSNTTTFTSTSFVEANYVPKIAMKDSLTGRADTTGFLVPTNPLISESTMPMNTGSTSSGGSISSMFHNVSNKLKNTAQNLGKPRRVKMLHRDTEERFRMSFENLLQEPILFESQCKCVTSNRVITGLCFLTPHFFCFSEHQVLNPLVANNQRTRFIIPLSEITAIQRGLVVNAADTTGILNVVPTPANFDAFNYRDSDNLVIQLFDKQGRVHEFTDFYAFSQLFNMLWFVWSQKSNPVSFPTQSMLPQQTMIPGPMTGSAQSLQTATFVSPPPTNLTSSLPQSGLSSSNNMTGMNTYPMASTNMGTMNSGSSNMMGTSMMNPSSNPNMMGTQDFGSNPANNINYSNNSHSLGTNPLGPKDSSSLKTSSSNDNTITVNPRSDGNTSAI